MNGIWKKAGLGVALVATALTTAAPAAAQRYRGYHHYYRGGYGDGALIAGIAGLAVGAVIVDSARPRYEYPARPYYDGYYRDDGYYRGGYEGCWVEWRWDPYYRHDVRVRVCG